MKSRISLVCIVVLMVYRIDRILKMAHHLDILQIQRAGDAASAMSTTMANSRVQTR